VTKNLGFRKKGAHIQACLALLAVVVHLVVAGSAWAQSAEQARVQTLTRTIEIGRAGVYTVVDLKEGDILFVHAARKSGNLDPFVGLSSSRYDAASLGQAFDETVRRVVAEGRDPLEALPEIYREFLVAWDDDSGSGYDSALEYKVAADGDYQLLVVSSPTRETFGAVELLVGVNAPQVLTGRAAPTGDVLVVLDEDALPERVAVQEIVGTLGPEVPEVALELDPLGEGDTLYAYAERTSGDLMPVLSLRDFGEKPLRSANLSGLQPSAKLSYQFDEEAASSSVRLSPFADSSVITSGDFRLLLGVNAPQVLTGKAETTDQPVLSQHTDVAVGVLMEQITNVDQISEKFGAVAELRMEWQDDKLAYSPASCQCRYKTFSGLEFEKYVADAGTTWPEFTFTNQQGNRWIQNRNAAVWPDGRAFYFERFTTDFQAPDFDFRRFPFDIQQLYLRLRSVYPEEFYSFVDSAEFSGIGEALGEEEWYIIDSATETGIQDSQAAYALGFKVERHLQFYVFRILVPIVLIVLVSWFTFFLKDYGKRVDVSSANLLVFVAFNFTVSGELPRLGYLTYMDAVMIGVFAVSALAVAFNVVLKRLELRDNRALAESIDRFAIWVYPLLYVLGGALIAWLFLLR
jgi:hypothetical protein